MVLDKCISLSFRSFSKEYNCKKGLLLHMFLYTTHLIFYFLFFVLKISFSGIIAVVKCRRLVSTKVCIDIFSLRLQVLAILSRLVTVTILGDWKIIMLVQGYLRVSFHFNKEESSETRHQLVTHHCFPIGLYARQEYQKFSLEWLETQPF